MYISITKGFIDYIISRKEKSDEDKKQEGLSTNIIVSYKNLALDCSQISIYLAISIISSVFFTTLIAFVSQDIKFHVIWTYVCLAIALLGDTLSLYIIYKAYVGKSKLKELGISREDLYNIYFKSSKLKSSEAEVQQYE